MNPFKKLFGLKSKVPSCAQVNSFLADYMEGTLSQETLASFQSHMDMCPACISHFEQYKLTIELVHENRDVAIPDQLVEHTLEFLRKSIEPK